MKIQRFNIDVSLDITMSHRKEKNFVNSYNLVHFDGEIKTACELRFYRTNTRLYCCVWLSHKLVSSQSGSSFTTWGDHGEVAKDALIKAGAVFSKSFEHHTPEDLLQLVAEYLKLSHWKVLSNHG